MSAAPWVAATTYDSAASAIVITFSEAMSASGATDASNYRVETAGGSTIPIGSVTLEQGGARALVRLASPPTPGSVYTLFVRADCLTDLDGAPIENNLDLAVGGGIQIFTGRGDGTFAMPETYAADSHNVITGDFNGDRLLDLATTSGGQLSVLLGNGKGGFSTPVVTAVSLTLDSMSTGDFNKDGKLDLVYVKNTVGASVLLGQGNGSFLQETSYATGGSPYGVSVADYNVDGNLDLAVACFNGGVSVLLGNGSGGFSERHDYSAGICPETIANADFNGDGCTDIVVTNINWPRGISVLMNNGNGTFSSPRLYEFGNPIGRLAVGDFNNDGRLDVVAAHNSNQVSVLLNSVASPGNFLSPLTITVSGMATNWNDHHNMQVGDINNDGRADLVFTAEGTLFAALGNGNGTFSTPTVLGGGSHVVLGNFNPLRQVGTVTVPTDLVNFVVPKDGILYVSCIAHEAGATSEFGVGTGDTSLRTVLTDTSGSTAEVAYGPVRGGDTLHFFVRTQWGPSYYASTLATDFPAIEAFTDRDNSLGLGGAILRQTGTNTWLLSCDDAASGDDDDNDLVFQLRIGLPNTPPAASSDSYTTNEDALLTTAASVLANDCDVDGNALTAKLVTGPAHGSLMLHANGTFSYTPAANYHGTDTFTYVANDGQANSNVATVTLVVTPVNDPPLATNDQYVTNEDQLLAAAVGVLANDCDLDGNALTAKLVTGPTQGSLMLHANGTFSYTPAANYHGTDTFTYVANDGQADSNVATVTLVVTPVNDPPLATNDQYRSLKNKPLRVDAVSGVLRNDCDSDGDRLSVVLVTGPTHGRLTLNTDGSFTFGPQLHYVGIDHFQYRVSDGKNRSNIATVTITLDHDNGKAAPAKAADFGCDLAVVNTDPQSIAAPPAQGSLRVKGVPSAESARRRNNGALTSLCDDPLKKSRCDIVPRPESHAIEENRPDLNSAISALASRFADCTRWGIDNHFQSRVEDLFAQWDSDPLELLSVAELGI